jgi:hypothetical protein
MNCLTCSKETKNLKFCSVKCSNKNRQRSIESRIKTSAAMREDKSNPPLIVCLICGKNFYKFESKGKKYCSLKCSGIARTNVFIADFSLNGKGNHKRVLIHERGHKCEKCNNTEWLGLPITLQLEHEDGNHNNNEKSNLKLLCPNCHSQTPTYNRRKTTVFVSDQEFLIALKEAPNIYRCLCKLGLNSSSANYNRAKRLLKQN